jgi:type II secretory pathway predicted ATPase ExeA/tetratricopeptide (TPR) repeat protein
MYRSHFSLRERPFEISTDTRFLWMGEKHKEALAMLKYGVLARKGFLLLTGDVGTGKTTLVNALLQSLNHNTLVANVTDPLLKPLDFFNLIAASFNMGEKFDHKADFLIRFAGFLRQQNTDGKNVLLILDEAHRFSKNLLEQFRLLSNIELPERKLINMFLVGQNEFNRTLSSPECRALRQRITLTYNIQPLSEQETLQYIRYRLKVAGTEEEIFGRKAVAEVYRFSKGYPRLINILCDHALLTGYVKQVKRITPVIIQECSQELRLLGHTTRTSTSGFFEGGGDPAPSSAPGGPVRHSSPRMTGGLRREGAIRQASPEGPLCGHGITSERDGGTRAVSEVGRGTAGDRRQRPRYWLTAACIAFLVLASAVLLQKDLLLGTLRGNAIGSGTDAPPAPGLPRSHPDLPSPVEAESAALAGEERPTEGRPDGRPAYAEPSPYEKALREMEEGHPDRAAAILEHAIEECPADLPTLRTLYAEALRRQAGLPSDPQKEETESLLARAVELDPTNKEAYLDLGRLHTKANRYAQAIGAYLKAAELDDRSADTFFNLGFLYAATADYARAEQMFLRVAALRPDYQDKALFNLAVVQSKQGKTQPCKENLRKALALNPQNERARTLLRQIEAGPRGTP